MLIDFPKIPHRVRKHVRDVFARANEAVSAEMIQQPFTTEPALDTELIRELVRVLLSSSQLNRSW